MDRLYIGARRPGCSPAEPPSQELVTPLAAHMAPDILPNRVFVSRDVLTFPQPKHARNIRMTITRTMVKEQIHKSFIKNTAARRSPHRFRRTCCPLPQHLQGSLACLSSGRRPGPGSYCLGRSTAAGREAHRFQGICCPLRLHLQ